MMRMDYLEFASLMESFGITDRRFIAPLYSQLSEADGFGGDGLEFGAAVIKGIKPNDQLEAMLGAQMAVMHWAAMKYMRQVGASRGTENQELAVATATKLARTFTGQMEALKRYRTGGEQKVTVQHVSVNEGGHAIVGHVTHTKSRMPVLKNSKDETPAPFPSSSNAHDGRFGKAIGYARPCRRRLSKRRRAIALFIMSWSPRCVAQRQDSD